jgi:hypothetical protein
MCIDYVQNNDRVDFSNERKFSMGKKVTRRRTGRALPSLAPRSALDDNDNHDDKNDDDNDDNSNKKT